MIPFTRCHKIARVVPAPAIRIFSNGVFDLTGVGGDAHLVFAFLVDDELATGAAAVVVDPGLHGDGVGHLQAGIVGHPDEIIAVKRKMNAVGPGHRRVVEWSDRNRDRVTVGLGASRTRVAQIIGNDGQGIQPVVGR